MAINGTDSYGGNNISAYTQSARRDFLDGADRRSAPSKKKAFGQFETPSNLARTASNRLLAGVSAPEFGSNKMYTKTTQTRSDEEIKKDIIALAKKDAARGVNGFGDYAGRESKEYKALAYEYITPYSPDRKRIFAKRMGDISDGLKQNPIRAPHIDTSLMELMLTGEVKSKEKTGSALERLIRKYNGDLGGNTITGEVRMIKFREGGNIIGSWSSTYGWGYQPTDAEVSRRGEVANLYLQTWKKEMGIK